MEGIRVVVNWGVHLVIKGCREAWGIVGKRACDMPAAASGLHGSSAMHNFRQRTACTGFLQRHALQLASSRESRSETHLQQELQWLAGDAARQLVGRRQVQRVQPGGAAAHLRAGCRVHRWRVERQVLQGWTSRVCTACAAAWQSMANRCYDRRHHFRAADPKLPALSTALGELLPPAYARMLASPGNFSSFSTAYLAGEAVAQQVGALARRLHKA